MKKRANGSWQSSPSRWMVLAVVVVLGLLTGFTFVVQRAKDESGPRERRPHLERERESSPLFRSAELFTDDAAAQPPVTVQEGVGIEPHSPDSTAQQPPWQEALAALIAAGRAQQDPSAAIAALLRSQPGMGDQLLTLLLETEGGQDEQDAWMVALATALSIGKEIGDGEADHLQLEGVAEGDWASLWFDRGGTVLAMAELWIDGEERARYFPRFLQLEGVLEPWHAIELASRMESVEGQRPIEEETRARLFQLIEMSLVDADAEALAVAGEWLQSSIPELRRVAQQTVVSTLADDPAAAVRWIGQSEASLHVPLLEVVLGRISADQLPSFLDQAADLMVQQEYHGSALLSGFSRATELDLQQLIYQRGESIESEAYRNLVLFGSQGGLGRGGTIPPHWAQALRWVAATDPSQSVRGTALRICAMSWPMGDPSGFQQLIQSSDVDLNTAEVAAALLSTRESAHWSPGD
ncbi:MAG: hypothetical protein OSB12_07110 [Planctomycetota bacterium]|nr:hypothetical protein [Planctomycetota bacterium]